MSICAITVDVLIYGHMAHFNQGRSIIVFGADLLSSPGPLWVFLRFRHCLFFSELMKCDSDGYNIFLRTTRQASTSKKESIGPGPSASRVVEGRLIP